ncbi:MAG TPA: hypothetical protein VGX48_25800 [Pyrinomonadaceae bacterium]|nr:hypothetical protein [Pyrinomonadaceae bacterium]
MPGPRYTSCPTVLCRERRPTADGWVESLARGLDEAEAAGA